MKSTQLSLVPVGLHDFLIFPDRTAHAWSVEAGNMFGLSLFRPSRQSNISTSGRTISIKCRIPGQTKTIKSLPNAMPPPAPLAGMTLIGALHARCFFFNRVFRQERFKRFLWLLASLITNGATLRKCYLFSCSCKNVPYRQMFKTAFLQQKKSTTWKLYDRFFLILANKPQSSLVLYLKVWSRSWRTKCWSGLIVKCNANAKRICESWRTNRGRVSRLSTDYLHPQGLFFPNALLQETE